jgi:hypothetical protein
MADVVTFARDGNGGVVGEAAGAYDGSNVVAEQVASAANLAVAQQGNKAILGATPACWSVPHQPAAATQASASKAAGAAGVRHVATMATIAIEAVAAQTDIIVNLRDGATGVGTVLWTIRLALAAGQSFVQAFTLPNLLGTAATAMTLETAAAPAATNFASLVLNGFDAI